MTEDDKGCSATDTWRNALEPNAVQFVGALAEFPLISCYPTRPMRWSDAEQTCLVGPRAGALAGVGCLILPPGRDGRGVGRRLGRTWPGLLGIPALPAPPSMRDGQSLSS